MSNTPYQTTDPLNFALGTQYQTVAFYGASGVTGPIGVTGSISSTGSTGALKNLITQLVSVGLIKDNTSA